MSSNQHKISLKDLTQLFAAAMEPETHIVEGAAWLAFDVEERDGKPTANVRIEFGGTMPVEDPQPEMVFVWSVRMRHAAEFCIDFNALNLVVDASQEECRHMVDDVIDTGDPNDVLTGEGEKLIQLMKVWDYSSVFVWVKEHLMVEGK